MEVIASCAAPLSPHSPPRCKRTSLSYCPWRMHDVDDRIGGDVTTDFGTCKLVESKGPHEFRAFAERFRRQYGRGALSLYGGAAKTVEHLKLRMKAHLRKWNDLGVEAHEKLVMVAIRVHNMGGLVADGKQHGKDVGIEEAWIQANLSACQGVEAINQRRGGSGSYPADDESIILYVVYSPEPPSTARPRCLMKRAILEGTHVPRGTARDPWDLKELRCVERHGSAARAYRSAPVWAACVAELEKMGFRRTACARAESFGAFDATLASSLAHWWISTQENACNIMYSRLAAQDDTLPVHVFGCGEAWLDAEVAALREHVENDGPGKWGLCAKRVSAVFGSLGRTEIACSNYYRDNVFVEGADGAVQAEATRNRLLKELAKRVEARLVPLLGPTIPKAWHKTHVCLRAFKAALERAPPLPEAELRRALLGLTKAQVTKAEDDVRREMAEELAKADAAVAAAAEKAARKARKSTPRRATPTAARTPTVARTPTAAACAAPLDPRATRAVADIVADLKHRTLTRDFFAGKHFAVSGTLGDAFGEGVSQGRLRKVLVHLLGATVDPSQYMTNEVDYLIVGANASGPKIQKADCSPTTEIILAADVLAVLRRHDTKEAVRLWRESQAELAYFRPEDLRFLDGRVGFVTGGLRGFTKDEGLAAVFQRYGATLILPTDKHSRSKADFCVHGDLDDSNGLDVARINQIPVVRADALLALDFGSDAAPPRSAFGLITNVAGREPPRKRSRP